MCASILVVCTVSSTVLHLELVWHNHVGMVLVLVLNVHQKTNCGENQQLRAKVKQLVETNVEGCSDTTSYPVEDTFPDHAPPKLSVAVAAS